MINRLHEAGPRRLAVALAAAVVLAACQPAPHSPSSSPAGSGSGGSAVPLDSAVPSGSIAPARLGEVLRDSLSVEAILADLTRLEQIADANGGNRSAGTSGHDAAVEHVAAELRAAGYEVELHPVSVPAFRQDAPSVLEIAGGARFDDLRDFKAMLLSGNGDVTAAIHALGFDPDAQPGDRGGTGCDPSDWEGVPAGVIVLVQPGPCFRRDVIVNAQGRGVLAIVTSYPEWTRDHVLRPTLVNPADVKVPVIGASHDTGVALFQAAQAGRQVHVVVDATVEMRTSLNVIAETATGDPAHVVMLGGHLDSVIDGPGVNDDGSGTMALLEIARRLAGLGANVAGGSATAWRVRFAFWTGEEIGILGSGAYVRDLTSDEAAAIEAYLNLDMIGSPNGVREVYEGAGTARPTESSAIATLLGEALDASALAWQSVPLGGASDHAPFDQAGIPTSGLFSGANEVKGAAGVELFGGTAGLPEDPCYHLPCDRTGNVDPTLLGQLARAAAYVVGRLASGEVALGG